MVSDASAQILWADSRAGSLIEAWTGRNLRDLCLAGTADKAAELVARGRSHPVRAWELTLLTGNRPVTVSFNATPWNGHILLVGQLLTDEYQDAIIQVQGALNDVVALNREI